MSKYSINDTIVIKLIMLLMVVFVFLNHVLIGQQKMVYILYSCWLVRNQFSLVFAREVGLVSGGVEVTHDIHDDSNSEYGSGNRVM